MISSYRDLIVWQKAFQLSVKIFPLTSKFPKPGVYGIVPQMRRAAISIPSNIAEGHSRDYKQEYIQFLRIAFASGAELERQLLIAKELSYLNNKEYIQIDQLLTEVMKMLNVLIGKLKI